MTKDIHKIGTEAVALLRALNKAKTAKTAKIAKANDLIEERNEAVKPLLIQVRDHIAAGDVVNGCRSWSAWAKYAGVSKRNLNYIINGRKPGTPVPAPAITAHFNNVQFDKDEAYCIIEIEQKHELKYQGKRRDDSDFRLTEDNGNATHKQYEALNKEGKIVWTHTVREVSGSITVAVENEDGTMTEVQLVDALRKRMTAVLKSMRLWADDLTNEFNGMVKDTADWQEEAKERRSESAKRAAATRKKAKKVSAQPSSEGRNGAKVQPELAVHFHQRGTYSLCHKPIGSQHSNPTTKSWDKVTCDACLAGKAAVELEETLNSLPPTPEKCEGATGD